MSTLMADKLTTAVVAKTWTPERRKEYMAGWQAESQQKWADKGADLDIDLMRQKDRTRFGGILPPDIPARPADGWIQPQSLWECSSETQHARFCTCAAWHDGHPVNPQGSA